MGNYLNVRFRRTIESVVVSAYVGIVMLSNVIAVSVNTHVLSFPGLGHRLPSGPSQLAKGSSFTESIPTRKDINGSSEQVFKLGPHFVDALVQAIEAGTIAAIGTVNVESACLQYVFAPRVYKNLKGVPQSIVGNASDTIGEYSLVVVDLSRVRSFAVIGKRASFHKDCVLGETIPVDPYLADTKWKDAQDSIAATLLPTFFPIYFGQKVIRGDIQSEDTQDQFQSMGTGYELWANGAKTAVESLKEINIVIDNFNTSPVDAPPLPPDRTALDENIRKYLDPTWVYQTSVDLAYVNGPCSVFDVALSSDYPKEAQELGEIFNPSSDVPTVVAAASQPVGTFSFTDPVEEKREKDAKNGTVKLMLLLIAAEVDFKTGTVSNFAQAVPTKGMECVLEMSRVARPQAYADLLEKACLVASTTDPLSIRSTHMTMKVISKTLASSLISGNFAKTVATDLLNDASSVDPSVFMPQRCAAKVASIRKAELLISNEIMMDVPTAQRNAPKTAVSRIGTNKSVDDFTSLCVNIDTFISATADTTKGPKPLLHLIIMDFIETVNSPQFRNWYESAGSGMPFLHLHLALYGYLERVWINFAAFAVNFSNSNVVTAGASLEGLDTKPITEEAMTGYMGFKSHLMQVMALGTPLVFVPSNVAALKMEEAAPSTSSTGRNSSSREAGTSRAGNAGNSARARDGAGGAADRNASSSSNRGSGTNDNQARSAASTSNKRVRRTGQPVFDAAPQPMTNVTRGMFYLHNPSIAHTSIFPANLPVKVCPLFTCKGKECSESDAPECALGKHWKFADEIDPAVISRIGKHFKDNNIGWFNEYHFARVQLNADVKDLCGNRNGPKTRAPAGSASTPACAAGAQCTS